MFGNEGTRPRPFAPTMGRAAADKLNRAVLLCHRAAAPLVCIQCPPGACVWQCEHPDRPAGCRGAPVCCQPGQPCCTTLLVLEHHDELCFKLSHTVVVSACRVWPRPSQQPTALARCLQFNAALTWMRAECRDKAPAAARSVLGGVLGLCCGRRWRSALQGVCGAQGLLGAVCECRVEYVPRQWAQGWLLATSAGPVAEAVCCRMRTWCV